MSRPGGDGGRWWVLPVPGGIGRAGPSSQALYKVVESPGRPKETVVAGPFATKAEAEAWIAAKEKSPIKLPVPNPLTGLAAIGDFFARLGQASTWIRVAEVLLGLALIIVGLAKITGAGELAKKAAKVAAKTGLAAA